MTYIFENFFSDFNEMVSDFYSLTRLDPSYRIYFNHSLFEDIPANTSLEFDFLLSWSTMPYYGWVSRDGDFNAPWTFSYVKLKDHVTDIGAINRELTDLANTHITTLEKRGHTARYALSA